jgi:hypothetical protein
VDLEQAVGYLVSSTVTYKEMRGLIVLPSAHLLLCDIDVYYFLSIITEHVIISFLGECYK